MTREEYFKANSDEFATDRGRSAHRRYYAQFVTPGIISFVRRSIGDKALLASTDYHLNDIPLPWWDRLAASLRPTISEPLRAQGDFYSLSSGVCIAKEAARQWLETNRTHTNDQP